MTDAQAVYYQSLGFEIGVHVTTSCGDWTESSLASDYTQQLGDFYTLFPSMPTPDSERTHCIAWSEWATQPKIELQNGIRLDTNYYYWPGSWLQDRPGMFTGSGMPMRFADLDGTMIDVYQATTQMTDESDQSFPYTIDTLLDRAQGPEGYFGFFTANMHNDSVTHASASAIVASAQARGVPVISARQIAHLDRCAQQLVVLQPGVVLEYPEFRRCPFRLGPESRRNDPCAGGGGDSAEPQWGPWIGLGAHGDHQGHSVRDLSRREWQLRCHLRSGHDAAGDQQRERGSRDRWNCSDHLGYRRSG